MSDVQRMDRRTFLRATASGALVSMLAARPVLGSDDGAVWDETFDLIIIGSGGAGLAAAARASELGLKVCVLEKEAVLGGNTRQASGYIAGPWPRHQQAYGIVDSPERFASEVRANAGASGDERLIEKFSHEAGPTLDWLEGLGLQFQKEVAVVSGTHFPRSYKPLAANGEGYIRVLSTRALRLGAKIRTEHRVVRLLTEESAQSQREMHRITGVGVMTPEGVRRLRGRVGVLIASGGFSADEAMVRRFAPNFASLTHDNVSGATGEMLREAQRCGAELIDMDKIQCQPGCPPGRTHRVRLHNEVSNFIFIDHQGRRFIREDARRDLIRDAVLALNPSYGYVLVDEAGFRRYNRLIQKETVLGVESGDAFVAYSLEALAEQIGVPAANLKETVLHYNDAVVVQSDPLGKDMTFCRPIEKPPFWACLAGMTRHATEGGIRIDSEARVLRADGSVINGLWAAGEATGGLHGQNQMGGNGLMDALTFGRLAAESVVEIAKG